MAARSHRIETHGALYCADNRQSCRSVHEMLAEDYLGQVYEGVEARVRITCSDHTKGSERFISMTAQERFMSMTAQERIMSMTAQIN